MLIIWTLLITATSAQKVFESTEDIGPEAFQNVTTLYPFSNTINKTAHIDNITNNHLSTNDVRNDNSNNSTNTKADKTKVDATAWKIEASFAESNLDKHEKENVTEDTSFKKNDTKEFRPSPHLGSFYDEESLQVTPTIASFGSFTPVKKPSSGFVSSGKTEFRSSFNKIPKQMLQTHKQYPFKFESPILTKYKDPWRHERPDSLESRPTVEIPVRVPAGGFYKYEEPFKEKPTKDDDEDFGLAFNEDGKDIIPVKKRVNPFESFLRLVTAFLPVGLIISALTPSIITIENTGPGGSGQPNTYPSNVFRRSDPGIAELPVISERCRRRLLCELHSEKNYKSPQNSPRIRGKQCYKIHCEDTQALARTLQWLLEYRRTAQNGHYT